MRKTAPRPRDLKAWINAYSKWVEHLRAGKTTRRPPLDEENPLARLGLQLQLLEEALREREERYQQLFNLVESLEKSLTVQDVLDRIFDGFSELIPYDRIDCALLSEDGRQLTSYWTRLRDLTRTPTICLQPMAGSGLEEILRSNRPQAINDLERYLDANPTSDAIKRLVSEGGRSNLTCPLMVGHRPIGFIFFTSEKKNAYTDVHATIFRQIASQISAVIDKSRVYQKIIERNRQLVSESQKFERAATHDPLTGTLNRGAIVAELEQALRERQPIGKPIGVIMADIDFFKRVNDTLGHPAGDAVLVEFTRRIAASLREGDKIGRYGGEEFLIIAPGATRDATRNVAERLRHVIASSAFTFGGHEQNITATFGAAVSTDDSDTAESIVAAADQALYAAKDAGRNRVVVA